jgi:SAM-dependent MidA family methyltransferase
MELLTSSEALEHCRLLSNHIDKSIKKNGGWIHFAEFMQLALYTPNLGYYTGGAFKFGEKGDFITAPEISSLFGATISRTISPVLEYFAEKNEVSAILEFGAGSGKLCEDILTYLPSNQLPAKYLILEVSPELISRQKERLLPFLATQKLPTKIEWVSSIPEVFTGVMIANEVLDALPVDLIIKDEDQWFYWGISNHPHPSSPYFSDHWQYQKGPLVPVKDIPFYIKNHHEDFPNGYVTEIHLQSHAWMKHICDSLYQGIFITFDYGFPEHEYYHPQRVQGTHIAHHRHQSIPDMFYLPGLCDLTAHVEWTSLDRIAQENDLSLIHYQSQGAYLLQAGIGDLFINTVDPSDSKDYTKTANALQKLISEAEMGELFKVIAWSSDNKDEDFAGLCANLPGFTGRMRSLAF